MLKSLSFLLPDKIQLLNLHSDMTFMAGTEKLNCVLNSHFFLGSQLRGTLTSRRQLKVNSTEAIEGFAL